MKRLPVLVSVPHGGETTPEELLPYTNMDQRDIFLDGDSQTTEIYNFSALVSEVHQASIARCYIDLNRSEADLPPVNHDGVLKTVNLFGKAIYKENWFPDQKMTNLLLAKYYRPYHQALAHSEKRGIELAIDCHSMLNYPPDFGKETTEMLERPEICIGNLGDEYGNPIGGNATSCSKEVFDEFEEALRMAFFNEDIRVSKNEPFKGGYITQHHGTESSVPWIQVELNRKLYLDSQYLDPVTQRSRESRIKDLNQKIKKAVRHLFS